MKIWPQSSQIFLPVLLSHIRVLEVGGLLSIRSADHPQHARDISTTLFSEATISPPTVTETKSTPSKLPCPSDTSTRKRLGKSSFLYKQQTNASEKEETSTEATISSPDGLRELAMRHSGKTVGSFQYKKAWTRWLYLAVESIRQDLGENLLLPTADGRNNDHNDGDTRAVRRAFEKLFFDLGVAADEGTMPSFENADARKGYALEFFCRARALAEFLLDTPSTEKGDLYPEFWTRSLRSPECPLLGASSTSESLQLIEAEEKSTYEIVSLGGGPGFDFAGVALAAAFSFHTLASGSRSSANIHVTAMDYEEGWSDLVSAMDRSTRNLITPSTDDDSFLGLPAMSCDWGGKCDITKSILNEAANANCKRLLLGDDGDHRHRQGSCRLWICQYCVAENAKALRDSDYVFFKELVQEMSAGTLVLLTEVVPRLWPEIVRMLDREGLLPLIDVGFRKGYRGKQFLLRKRETRRSNGDSSEECDPEHCRDPFKSLDERTRDQLEHFERLASYHNRKVDSGWKRQGRKANGSSYHEEQEIYQRQTDLT